MSPRPSGPHPLEPVVIAQLQCDSLATAAPDNIRVTRLTGWAEGISVFEIPDVVYLPEYGIQICCGFVPEEAINYRDHLEMRLGRWPDKLSTDETIINSESMERSPVEVCILGHIYSHVFGHWCEELLKVVTLEKFGFSGFYVLPDWYPSYCHDSLRLLDVPSARVITVNKPVRYERALLPTTIHHFNAHRFPNLILHLRDRLYAGAAREVGAGPRIWVERGQNAKGRDVINKDEVYACIKKYDFVAIDFGQYTFGQQIGIDREISVMLGPHGSASVHCGFMPIGGEVIEIFSPFYINPSVLQLCQAMCHSYHQIVPPNTDFDPYKFGLEIKVDIDHLELVLSTVFRSLDTKSQH